MKPLSPDRFSLYSSLSSLSGGLTVFTSNSDIQGVSTIVEDRTTLDKVKHRSAVSCPVRLDLKHRSMHRTQRSQAQVLQNQNQSGTALDTHDQIKKQCQGSNQPLDDASG